MTVLMDMDPELARRKLKRIIEKLRKIKGRHSSLTTVYIPPDKSLIDVINFLRQEYMTASNIKDKTNRKMVQDNILTMINEIQKLKKIPENGVALFYGYYETSPGKFEQVKEIVVPPFPIKNFIYICGKDFDLRPLEEMTIPKNIIVVVLMEAGNYVIGIIRGKDIEVLKEGEYYVIGKTRRGGQSARRYERIREEQIHNFYKHLAKEVNELLLPELENIDAIVFGGNTIRVQEFLEENLLDYRLRDKIVTNIISVPIIDGDGIFLAAKEVAEIVKESEIHREKRLWEEFKTRLMKDDSLVTYGKNEVMEYLKQGRVETVLISEALEDILDEVIDLAEKYGTKVEIFGKNTESGKELLGFGGIAAILRW